jgi:hypothetical protein
MTTTPTEFDPKEDPELFEIATLASAIDTRRDEISELQEQLDEKVIEARRHRYRFREIAHAAGRSISWVQASLDRTAAERSSPTAA